MSNTTYRRYVVGLNNNKECALNEAAIEEDKKKDGFFGILTNVRGMSAEEIGTYYKGLWIVEDAFGEIKGTLKARPVFHWRDDRIVGHLTICFMGYLCEALMTQALRDKT